MTMASSNPSGRTDVMPVLKPQVSRVDRKQKYARDPEEQEKYLWG